MNDGGISNQPIGELERLTLAAREALTDSMVERLAITGANAAEIIDRLNDESTRLAVHALIDRVTELHRVGALDTLFDLTALLHAARNASTDNIVERLFTFFEQMINTVGNESMGRIAENTREALEVAAAEAANVPAKGGLLAALALLSKPEAQQSLAFLLRFGENLRQKTTRG